MKKTTLILIILFLSFHKSYALTNLLPTGSESILMNDYIAITYNVGNDIHIHTRVSIYKINKSNGFIECYQKIGRENKNLSIYFPSGHLNSLSMSQNSGRITLSNSHVILNILSDGTLWIECDEIADGAISFFSYITHDYERGAGDKINDSQNYPDHCETLLKSNWFVLTNDGSADNSVTGGFGIYCRPMNGYKQNQNSVFGYPLLTKGSPNPNYTVAYLHNHYDYYSGPTRFIVSLFPSKYQNSSISQERIQFIYPNMVTNRSDAGFTRGFTYDFPTNEDLDSWIDDSLTPFMDDDTSHKFQYYMPGTTNQPVPVTKVVLFEDIWRHTREQTDQYPDSLLGSGYERHAYIPYQTPTHTYSDSDTRLRNFISNCTVDVLCYFSALDEYNQICHPLFKDNPKSEEYYFDQLTSCIVDLFDDYGFDGLYIDTLPLNGDENLEPITLAYRLLRWIKDEYPNKFIILHSTENPIGLKRVWGSNNSILGENDHNQYRWNESGLIQSEIYCPFIDRYADVIMRGEGYPIDVKLQSNYFGSQLKTEVADYIKYVADPIGKSNCAGIFQWSDTKWPISSSEPWDYDVNWGYNNAYRTSYFNKNYPVSFPKNSTSWNSAKNSGWQVEMISIYTPQLNTNHRAWNRLMVMNQILETYVSTGHLIMRSSASQRKNETIGREYARRMHGTYIGPGGHGSLDPDDWADYLEGWGPTSDYYRSVTVYWHVSNGGSILSLPKNLQSEENIKTNPIKFSLEQNYPNPFNPITSITFNLPSNEHVSLYIYNVSGRLVKTLINIEMEAGSHSVQWNGINNQGVLMSSGIYLCRIKAGDYTNTIKMSLLK